MRHDLPNVSPFVFALEALLTNFPSANRIVFDYRCVRPSRAEGRSSDRPQSLFHRGACGSPWKFRVYDGGDRRARHPRLVRGTRPPCHGRPTFYRFAADGRVQARRNPAAHHRSQDDWSTPIGSYPSPTRSAVAASVPNLPKPVISEVTDDGPVKHSTGRTDKARGRGVFAPGPC